MKIIKNPFRIIKDFFSSKFEEVENKIDNESKELNNVEYKLDEIKDEGGLINKKINEFSGWSDRKMIKFWFFGLFVGVVGYFAYNTLNFIFIVISAYIVSVIVESLIFWFQGLGIKRGMSIFLSYLIFILTFFLLFIIVVPFLINQTIELISVGISYLIDFQTYLTNNGVYNVIVNMEKIPDVWKEYFFDYFGDSGFLLQIQTALQQNLNEIISIGKNYVTRAGVLLISFISGFTNFLVNFGIFITLAILFSVEKNLIMKFLAKIGGKDNYDVSYLKINKMYKKLAIWLKARLAMSLFITIAMWIALIVMGWFGVEIPNKLGIAVFTGLLDIIPYVGPIISGAILFIVGMLYNTIWVSFISVGVLYIINVIQNNILTPVFMNKALGISSVLIFISMILGGMIMGFFGVLLAVPIAVIITLLLQDKQQLNEKDERGYDLSSMVFNYFRNFFIKDKVNKKN